MTVQQIEWQKLFAPQNIFQNLINCIQHQFIVFSQDIIVLWVKEHDPARIELNSISYLLPISSYTSESEWSYLLHLLGQL